jgi:hypothetical protein
MGWSLRPQAGGGGGAASGYVCASRAGCWDGWYASDNGNVTCKRCPSGSVREYGRNPETGSYGDVCVSCPAGKTLSSIPVSFAATDSSTPSTVVPATNIRNLSTISSSSSDVYSSSTGYLQVVFTSDSSVTRPGFEAHWNVSSPVGATVSCTCNEAMPATCAEMSSLEDSTSGTFSLSDYANNARCEWLITADGGEAVINLTFASFETERCCDYVVINRCQSSSCADPEQIARLSGDGLCPPGWNLDPDSAGTCISPCPYGSQNFSVDGVFACYNCSTQNGYGGRRPYPSQSNSGAEPTCQTCPGTNMIAWDGSCYSCPEGAYASTEGGYGGYGGYGYDGYDDGTDGPMCAYPFACIR